jgi:phosphatidylinositol glycan class B
MQEGPYQSSTFHNNMTDRSSGRVKDKQPSQSDHVNHRTKLFKLFVLISIYRLANAWMIRTQFDPDEYWQTLEPAYCLAFGKETATAQLPLHPQKKYGCALTWEWTRRKKIISLSSDKTQDISSFQNIVHSAQAAIELSLHGPVRSYVSILPTYWYYLGCRSLFQWASTKGNELGNSRQSYGTKLIDHTKQFVRQQSTYLISKGPAFLHAISVAVPTDLSVWVIASHLERLAINHRHDIIRSKQSLNNAVHLQWWQSWASWALILTITSWFNGYALIRTYANSIETMFLMVGIALLVPELFGDISAVTDQRRWRHRLRARIAFVLGGLSACVRFTSLAAWVPIGVIIVLRENTTAKKKLSTLFGLCAANGLLGVILGCCVDRWIYGFWAVPFLGNFHFNAVLGLGSLYGTHPMLWYIYAGIPAICGIVLPMFLWEVLLLLTKAHPRTNDPDTRSRLTILWIIASYSILHSFSEHKEFRFLLPVLPLMFILAAHAMVQLLGGMSMYQAKLILVALCLLNYPHVIYLGTIHQRGPISANALLASIMNNEAQQNKSNNHFSVHYLMGCHSAPAYSHLHNTDVYVDVDYLDCSPECRSNEDITCESDAFSNDPYEFMHSTYFATVDGECEDEESVQNHSCTLSENRALSKQMPTFVVIMQDDALKIEGLLTGRWNATRVASVKHSVASISLHKKQPLNTDVLSLFSLIDIHFEHIEVYSTL